MDAEGNDSNKRAMTMPVIGWKEYVAFPEWHISHIRAKVDTGAQTTSLHVEDIEELPDNRVKFHVITSKARGSKSIEIVTDIKRIGMVRSSNGVESRRYFVETRLRMGNMERVVEVNLENRHQMKYRMLVGRSTLEGMAIVDVSQTYTIPQKTQRSSKKGSL